MNANAHANSNSTTTFTLPSSSGSSTTSTRGDTSNSISSNEQEQKLEQELERRIQRLFFEQGLFTKQQQQQALQRRRLRRYLHSLAGIGITMKTAIYGEYHENGNEKKIVIVIYHHGHSIDFLVCVKY